MLLAINTFYFLFFSKNIKKRKMLQNLCYNVHAHACACMRIFLHAHACACHLGKPYFIHMSQESSHKITPKISKLMNLSF